MEILKIHYIMFSTERRSCVVLLWMDSATLSQLSAQTQEMRNICFLSVERAGEMSSSVCLCVCGRKWGFMGRELWYCTASGCWSSSYHCRCHIIFLI